MSCDERLVQLSALLDGELRAAEVAELTTHLAVCPDCARRLAELGRLRAALADAVPEEEISAAFLARIEAALNAATPAPASAQVLPFVPRRRPDLRAFVLGAVAAAAAAMLLFTSMKPPKNIIDLAAVHDASLRGGAIGLGKSAGPTDMPGIPGFELASAHRDIVAGHAAEVLAYTAPQGSITLCIWKANGEPAHTPREGNYRGTNIMYWNNGREEYWVAGSLPMQTIEAFGQLVRSGQS